jgi:hypothetical protein
VQILAPSPQAVVSALVEKLNPKYAPAKHKNPVAMYVWSRPRLLPS